MEKASLQEWSLYNGLDETVSTTYFTYTSMYSSEINMSVASIRLQPNTEDLLNKLSKKLDGNKKYLINQAVKEYV